uniref:Glycosyltransferase family 92 protein n=1 Tax=Strongyloides venezuelensis TaxID=75913 RepID=A0A0K0F4X4_STRVS
MLAIGNKYKLNLLKLAAEEKLMEVKKIENVCDYLVKSELHSSEILHKWCVRFICMHAEFMTLDNTIIIFLSCLFISSIYVIFINYYTKVLLEYSLSYETIRIIKIIQDKSVPDDLLRINYTLWKPKDFGLDCSKVINGDRNYINKMKKKRFSIKEIPKDYKYDCESIKSRGFYPKVPLSDIEANYPIAYARNVYNNYLMLELEFLVSYAPQNHYCFSVDLKSSELYIQLTSLSKCFNNVYISQIRYNMTSEGIYQALSTYECMKILKNKKWNYLFILQNDDFPIKTNREIVEILTATNSCLNMQFCDPSSFVEYRIDLNANWDYKSLNFFNDAKMNKYDKKLLSKKLQFSKGTYASGIPRDSIDYILNNISIEKYLNQINTADKFGEDEMVWQTLFSDNFLKIPHYVERDCHSTEYNTQSYMVRDAIWSYRKCKSTLMHHRVCVYGIEMFDEIKSMKRLFGYRFLPDRDFGAALCFVEYLVDKTYRMKFDKIDTTFYVNLPSTKYQNADQQTKKKIIKNCTLNKEW